MLSPFVVNTFKLQSEQLQHSFSETEHYFAVAVNDDGSECC